MMDGLLPRRFAFSLVLLLSLGHTAISAEDCVQDVNCHLPDCFCPTFSHPLGRENIPQIVYFGFDDAVQVTVSSYYDQLFTKQRTNPNGCPISMTLYVSHEYTDYTLVNEYYEKGNEMGVHSVTHTDIDTAAKLLQEATEQKMNIEYKGQVPSKDIVGWRSPNLKTAGDDQPRILKQLNYTYDNSLTYTRDFNYPFPFTLDYGYPYPCMVKDCPGPNSKHEGFWEIMIHSLTDPKTDSPCGYVDGCRPDSEDDALEYLWSNFLHTYESEKAPFGLNMHAAWFAYPDYLPAMKRFIDRLLQYPDVFIVSVDKMLHWMKDPTPLSEINSFKPWGCKSRPVKRSNNEYNHRNNLYDFKMRTTTTSQPKTTTTSTTTTTTTTTRTIRTQRPTKATPIKVQTSWNRFIPQATVNRGRQVIREESECIQGKNCHLPMCACRSKSPPRQVSLRDLPQIMYLSVSTPIDGNTFRPLTRLLWPPRRNQNGSPVAASVFIPVTGNYLPYVEQLRNMGVRLGLQLQPNNHISVTEINHLRRSLSAYYGVEMSKVGNEYLGRVFQAFQGLNDTIDSFIVKEGSGFEWPYTLDYGAFTTSTQCSPFMSDCTSQKYPGLWEVEISPMSSLPSTEIDTFRLLKFNFDRHYFTNKSPFGVNINQNWMLGRNGRDRVRGLNLFIDYIIRQPNVLVLPIDQMLAWLGSSFK